MSIAGRALYSDGGGDPICGDARDVHNDVGPRRLAYLASHDALTSPAQPRGAASRDRRVFATGARDLGGSPADIGQVPAGQRCLWARDR